MPPHRSDRRRRREDEPSARSRSPTPEEENATEPASAQRCVGEHVGSMQNQQEASAITATSSSSPGMQTVIAQDDTDASPLLEHCHSLSPVSCILARTEIEWGGYMYYIRLDRQGSFHTYPDLDGPYQSLQEAQMAIDRHLEERRHPKMYKKQDDVSPFDMMIRRHLYWPDGKRRSISRGLENGRDKIRRLLLDLLDKYNEDHHLEEDLAYKLKDVLNFQLICEECTWYYHLNFITTSEAEGDREVFAEVKNLEMFFSCFCMVDPTDKGQHCNGCTIIGNVNMKHPDCSVQLAAGHLDPRRQCCQLIRGESDSEDEDTFLKVREVELRRMYKIQVYFHRATQKMGKM